MIVAQQLGKSFATGRNQPPIVAVDGVSFRAEDGQITGLLGPNGAGKTTTLRLLYTLMRPDQGQLWIDGIDALANPHQARQHLGVLPDARSLYKRLTARENIAYFGRLQGLSSAAITERIAPLAAALQMEAILDRRCEGFSQGQRTKTAIARALIHAPNNVILDEPSNGLDVMSTRSLRHFLLDLRAQGRCVVLSSHIMQEVAQLCDHIIIIAGGRIIAQGSAEDLRQQAGKASLEEAFMQLIDSGVGLHA